MKAIGYKKAHPFNDFQLTNIEASYPQIKARDLCVRIKAVSVNPVDYKIRQSRSSISDQPVILGWDAAGVVEAVGERAHLFKVGDEVFYAGEITRDGSNAELQAVDERIVAKKPTSLSFAQAAALPLTCLTAWEALFEKCSIQANSHSTVLLIGGGGGVGSISIQLLRALTNCVVIATASRPETKEWCHSLGAHHVIDHQNLEQGLKNIGIPEVNAVFCTTHSDDYLGMLPAVLKPFGHVCVIDEPKPFDLTAYKPKAISFHWELMFTKSLFQYNMESQGDILKKVADLVDEKKIVETSAIQFHGFSVSNFKKAHELLESGKSRGKIVIDF